MLRQLHVKYVVAVVSVVLGILISLVILQSQTGSVLGGFEDTQEVIQATAYFRNGKLIVTITNLGSREVEVQMIFLEGRNYMDFDMFINAVIAPGERTEIETDIMQPESPGRYTVRIKLSNGQTVDCSVDVR
mgnify:CR=1 FL=1